MKEFKIGDKLFSIRKGWGEVTELTNCDIYPVDLTFHKVGQVWNYSLLGHYYKSDIYPELFRSPQDAAEYFSKIKTKRVVRYERWVNIYTDGIGALFESEAVAKNLTDTSAENYIETVKWEYEKEIEE